MTGLEKVGGGLAVAAIACGIGWLGARVGREPEGAPTSSHVATVALGTSVGATPVVKAAFFPSPTVAPVPTQTLAAAAPAHLDAVIRDAHDPDPRIRGAALHQLAKNPSPE